MSGRPLRGWRPKGDKGVSDYTAAGGEEAGTGDAAALSPGRVTPGEHVINVLYGIRQPIVAILLIIAFMAAISGKPLDGLLTLIAGVSLGWDTGRRARARGKAGQAHEDAAHQAREVQALEGRTPVGQARSAAAHVTGPATTQATGPAAAQATGPAAAQATGSAGTARLRRPLVILAGLACGAAYALVVGSFSRFSWPATVPVVALGTVVVMIGWRERRRVRPVPGPLPVAGTALWGGVFVAGCLWELTSLLQQPNLETGSYTHPTISTLTDPVLASMAGRAVVLAAWLGLGWFLVER
jgi:hypothetical protein